MTRYIYRNRHSWERDGFVRHLMIDKIELVNETEWHWEVLNHANGNVLAINKKREGRRIHNSLAKLYPAALEVAEEEIQAQRQSLQELLNRPVNDSYFTKYIAYHKQGKGYGREAHIKMFEERIESAIAEAMRIREMFTIGPIMSSPFPNARELT